MFIEVLIAMFVVGLILGFVGAGGSGFIISILTVVFGFSIHTVLGTALLAMLLSSISGVISHYREKNIQIRTGLIIGCSGGIGAWFGSMISVGIPDESLKGLTASMLILSGIALWFRMSIAARRKRDKDGGLISFSFSPKFMTIAIGIGIVTGTLSGVFGIGSTPFIQIGLMTLLGLSVRLAAGTTLLIIIPIALGGGLGFYYLGVQDLQLLLQVGIGIMLGSYLGAKFTSRVPVKYLQAAMVIVPITGGTILLL